MTLLTILSILCITQSLYIYSPCCAFRSFKDRMTSRRETDSSVSHAHKNTIELQAISLNETSRPHSAHSMTAVESSASGL